MSRIINLADAVVARLNTATLSQSFTAVKELMPIDQLDDVVSLEVSVAVGGENWEKIDRSAVYSKVYDIFVVIRAPLTSDNNSAIEPYILLSQEIKDDLVQQRLTGLHVIEVQQDAPFDLTDLADSAKYFTVITFKYKGL